MKKILLALYIIASPAAFAFAQKDTADIVVINKLPANGLLLQKGWKFHPGDDLAFARVDYDDKNWQKIDPTHAKPDVPIAAQQGIGWLRIRLNISPALRHNATIFITQCTAIEIYLNGRIIGRRGTINSRLKTGRGYYDIMTPIPLPLKGGPDQVLAIRFAHEPFLNHFNGYLFTTLVSVLFTSTPQMVNHINAAWRYRAAVMIGTGILLLLAIMHMALFSYNTKNKGNLYFAGYAIFFALYAIFASSYYLPQYVDTTLFFFVLSAMLVTVSGLLAIKALYVLFKFPPQRFYSYLIIVCIILRLAWVLNTNLSAYTGWGVSLLLPAVEFWLTIRAVKSKRRGAYVIAAGFLTGLVGVIGFVSLFYFQAPDMIGITVIVMAMIGPALGISVFLGREFALDSLLLESKLTQVEELSAQTIAQEQEKQELLTSQNEQLEKQVNERTAELNQSLTHLKQTQTQLIQSEKMASLGELTAGIAHEIQNPLNFVNNFSEVNREMIGELKAELKGGNVDEALFIADDIEQNEEKINHHGKRADAIVKGMLQHSKVSSGKKEPTNINALADEYMHLAYHGLRSKDKSFNAELITNFDSGLPKINVVPQDIGRVMLNLFNNAFYAVNQKLKTAGADYKPEVTVTTFTPPPPGGGLGVKVKDNGTGIPDQIKDKIMQPFFTTKPTGEGTGLGLSLTYDMVVKGHGGSIAVDTKEGEFTEFTVSLPITASI